MLATSGLPKNENERKSCVSAKAKVVVVPKIHFFPAPLTCGPQCNFMVSLDGAATRALLHGPYASSPHSLSSLSNIFWRTFLSPVKQAIQDDKAKDFFVCI